MWDATRVTGEEAVARAVGREALPPLGFLQARVGRVPLPSHLPAEIVRVWFDRKSKRFFCWLISESPQEGVTGLIAETSQEAEHALERLLRAHGRQPRAYQAADALVRPLGVRLRRLKSKGRGLLTGDAAGQVKATTVDGVGTGMRCAQAAARSLMRRTSDRRELRPLQRELDAHAMVRHVLDRLTEQNYDDLVRLINRQETRVLGSVSRDEMTRVVWRLLRAQPRWLLLPAGAPLRGRMA